MSPLPVHFARFLNAVYRRLVLLRLLERIGIAIAFSCGVALIAAVTLLMHNHPAMAAVESCLAAGFIGGLIWGLIRRPHPLQAAMEADRQLHLDDLLSSAWMVSNKSPDNPWLEILLAQADSRCQKLSASSPTLWRLGSRAWGGIALSAALVLTLASFGPSSAPRQVADTGRPLQATTIGLSDPTKNSLLDLSASPDHRPILLPDPDDPNASTFGQNSAPPPQSAKAGSPDASDSTNHAPSASSDDSHGAGSARTNPPTAKKVPTPEQPSATTGHSDHKTGDAAAGTGNPSAQASGNDATTAGTVAGITPAADKAPTWQSNSWPANVDRARRALDAGHIPAAYRDLVRSYFTP
jgi:hypothetical protein